MSIFSSLRKSRRHAKEHAAKVAEQKKLEENREPYKHVPTHAASDAFACAPPSWREENDRPKILEQNRRRSAMTAAGLHMNSMPGMPRISSRLSYVTYPSGDATPVVHLPRAQSYTSIHPYEGGRNTIYAMPDMAASQPTWKGKEVNRQSGAYDTPRISPTSSKAGYASQEGSTAGSSSSQDELEMASSRNYSHAPPSALAGDNGSVHRLHPSHYRRTSDGSEKVTNGNSKPTSQRDSRPPPSKRGFNSIALATAPPTSIPAGSLPGTLPPSSSVPHLQVSNITQPNKTQQQSLPSSYSVPSMASSTSKAPRSVPASTPEVTGETANTFDFALEPVSLPGPELDFGLPTRPTPAEATGASNGYYSQTRRTAITPTEAPSSDGYFAHRPRPSVTPTETAPTNGYFNTKQTTSVNQAEPTIQHNTQSVQKARKESRYPPQTSTRYAEYMPQPQQQSPQRAEVVAPPASYYAHTRADPSRMPPQVAPNSFVNVFPEASSPGEQEKPSSGKKKLTKGGAKLSKKNRWSLTKSSPITA